MSEPCEKMKQTRENKENKPPALHNRAEHQINRLRGLNKNESKQQISTEGHKLQGTGKEVLKQPQHRDTQLSQTVQSLVAKVQTSEAALEQEKRKIQETQEICNRQQQNLYELRSGFDQLEIQCKNEIKNREALFSKFKKVSQMLQAIGNSCNGVSNSLHKIVAEREAFEAFIGEMNGHSDQMQGSLSEIADSVSHYKENLQKKLNFEQEKCQNIAIDWQSKEKTLEEQSRAEELSARQEISELKGLLHDVELQILSEDKAVESLSIDLEVYQKENNKKKELLVGQLEALKKSCSCTERDVKAAEEEIEMAATELENLQSLQSEKETRKASLEASIAQLHIMEEVQLKSFLEREREVESLKRQLEEELEIQEKMNVELEKIRTQFKELEESSDTQIRKLTADVLQEASILAERENSLQNVLDAARLDYDAVEKEEEKLNQNLLEMNDDLQCISESLKECIESNDVLEDNLAAVKEDVQKLTKDKDDKIIILNAERSKVDEKEQALLEWEDISKRSVSEIQCQLESLQKAENLAVEELESLRVKEEDLCAKIEEAHRDRSNSCAQMTKHYEEITRELQNKLKAVENEVESLENNSNQEHSELNQNLTTLKNKLVEKDETLDGINVSISELKLALENCLNESASLSKELKEREITTTVLIEKTSQYSEELNVKQNLQQENVKNLKRNQLKFVELDCQISKLELQYKSMEAEYSKVTLENENEKQVFTKGLLSFQNTCKLRSDEIKGLQKQISLYGDKIAKCQEIIDETSKIITPYQSKASDAEMKYKDVLSKVQEWQGKVLNCQEEAAKAEKEASLAKKKADHLKQKLAAHKAAKAEAQAKTFKVPSQAAVPQRNVTPQFSASASPGQAKDLTPRSILKTSSKPPTPQNKKNVSFLDFDDASSSSSSIMLDQDTVDKIVENPSMLNVLKAQHSERQAAKRQERSSRVLIDTPQPQQKSVTPQFIASTPSGQDKDLTPRSILRTASKPPTPQLQKKNVSFMDDLDDASSTASSIMLGPEVINRIAENPSMLNILKAQHTERQAAKRMRRVQAEDGTPSKKIHSENEISSSTPETAETGTGAYDYICSD